MWKHGNNRGWRFLQEEDGAMSIMALYFALIGLALGGLAVDFAQVTAQRTRLQVAADSVAHAALYLRESNSADDSLNGAMTLSDYNIDPAVHGDAITVTDVEFGSWDEETYVFTANATARSAVRVVARKNEDRNNPVQNLLLRLVGVDTFDVSATSVFTTFRPGCMNEGFVAEGIVDLQSNNSFSDGFCVHSNTHVSLNSNNLFEPGTVVSMPDENDLDLPKSGFETNVGLQAALRSGTYRLRQISKLEAIIDDLEAGTGEYMPSWVNGGLNYVSSMKVEPVDLETDQVNHLSCQNGKVTLDPGTYEDMVIVTDCEVKFSQGVILADVVLATRNTSAKSLNSPSGFQLGLNDFCAPGGGSILITLGGVDIAADLQVYGSQILAAGDIEFAANANGIQGAAFMAGGEISGTSNMDMGFCGGSGMDHVYQADYFRMVQ